MAEGSWCGGIEEILLKNSSTRKRFYDSTLRRNPRKRDKRAVSVFGE